MLPSVNRRRQRQRLCCEGYINHCNHGNGNDSAFVSNFAFYGWVGSLASLAILAAFCHAGRYYGYDYESDDYFLSGAPNNYIARHHRRIEELHHDNISESFPEASGDDGGMECENIFRNVKKTEGPQWPTITLKDGNGNTTKDAYSNNYLLDQGYNLRLCHYAQHCQGEFPSRTFLPLILCHGIDTTNTNNNNTSQNILQSTFLYLILPPLLLLYLALLFRLLATTADSYFSPALESLSRELGLPPRFAGATLLALGNGSPDLGATVNAILLWNEGVALENHNHNHNRNSNKFVQEGWTMGITSLTGGGMFVGTIVCGLLIQQTSDGIPCRFAFLRDVSMYAISVSVVWYTLEGGNVNGSDVRLFLGMYATYVIIVFCSDMYHRKVTLKKLRKEEKDQKQARRSARISATLDQENGVEIVNEGTPLMVENIYNSAQVKEKFEKLKPGSGGVEEEITNEDRDDHQPIVPQRRRRLSIPDRFAMLMSNYDPASVKFDKLSLSGSEDNSSGGDSNKQNNEDEMEWERIVTVIHEAHPGIHSSSRMSIVFEEEGCRAARSSGKRSSVDSLPGVPESASITAGQVKHRQWSMGLFTDAYHELTQHCHHFLKSSFQNETTPFLEKMLLFLELPFVALRTVTIPVPCEGHYCRSILASSLALSPYWVMWYTNSMAIPSAVYGLIFLVIALIVLRYADEDKLPLFALIPISLYGFFLAATWIDTIANALVGLLQFLGTVSRIPSTILGMTVLAWGNSMGDLSANVAMAKKGMPDMATTGCFAGPTFNLLVGTGLGFLYLQYEKHRSSISPVSLTPIIRIGFTFIIINCMLIIISSGVCFKRRLPYRYSFVLFAIYLLFIATSLESLFHLQQ